MFGRTSCSTVRTSVLRSGRPGLVASGLKHGNSIDAGLRIPYLRCMFAWHELANQPASTPPLSVRLVPFSLPGSRSLVQYATSEEARGAGAETSKPKWLLAVQSPESEMCCQRTGEPCDYSVRLNWEGRRTKRSLSLGTLTGAAQPSKDSLHAEQPPFNHTFTSSNPTQVSDPKPLTKPILTDPVSVETAKRKLEQLETHDDYLSQSQNTSSRSIQHQNGAPFAPPRSAPNNARGHSSTSSHRRIVPATANASQRLYKRSKSLAETCKPDLLSQLDPVSSPICLIGKSPPTSFLRSGAISTPIGSPLTPVSLVIKSDDETRSSILSLPSPASPEDSRLSVNYLLSSSPRLVYGVNKGMAQPYGPPWFNSGFKQEVSEEATFYGFDLGIPDADIAQNDDAGSIFPTVSSTRYSGRFLQAMCGGSNSQQSETINGTMPGVWYYGQPIPIWIPRNIEPIPAKLRENPMNVLVSQTLYLQVDVYRTLMTLTNSTSYVVPSSYHLQSWNNVQTTASLFESYGQG
ncbi:uncharacterized protein BDZ83DRAFT_269036 [Colletotrichum acutatum]|uniref:Uncharacterized protein n=1 Tax=Glomerella acutata TaxID=27357 RepID=A0AAD8UQ53_GLOAC|nr:uncharacterized protein BDZ83DRAFT_269036 [Colletotrichum acutatum]KAK1726260.1 hypothetical protein BDZ83DRAFT_269036 [Colletotrichum acutatum]